MPTRRRLMSSSSQPLTVYRSRGVWGVVYGARRSRGIRPERREKAAGGRGRDLGSLRSSAEERGGELSKEAGEQLALSIQKKKLGNIRDSGRR